MDKTLTVNILTPEGPVFNGQADAVFLPGSVSPFEVLRDHAPIISALEAGELKVVSGTEVLLTRQIKSGVVRVIDNLVSICARI